MCRFFYEQIAMTDIKNAKATTRLIADSGSTKTDWCVVVDKKLQISCSTQGINPFHQDKQKIDEILHAELLPQLNGFTIDSVRFYGAGCRGMGIEILGDLLRGTFLNAAENILVGSDLLAAAHALCGKEEGIACILGTGANSCLFDGCNIINNVSPLGYILGDEGSGAVLGRLFVNELFKGAMPTTLRDEFLVATNLTLDEIIRRTYRESMANRFLASFSPFIHAHLHYSEVHALVVQNFKDFFKKNIDHYHRQDLPVGAVGSMAFFYKVQLEEAAAECGYKLGKVLKSPLEGLL